MEKEYRTVRIDGIKPYANNPRLNDDAVDSVKKSIEQCGYIAPIIVDEDMTILAGHTRYKALQEIGNETADVIVTSGLTDEQKRKYRLLDNKTNELSEWDYDKLIEELDGLDFEDLDLDWGVDNETEDAKEAKDDEYDPVPPTVAQAKVGEVYQLGDHYLMCGDSTKASDIQILMNGAEADLIITDPPYNVNYGDKAEYLEEYGNKGHRNTSRIANDDMSEDAFYDFLLSAYQNMYDAMKLGAAIYVFHAETTGLIFRQAFEEAGLKLSQCLIWEKNALVLGRQDYQWKHEPILYGWKEGAAHYFADDRTQTSVLSEDELDFRKMKKADLVAYLEQMRDSLCDKTTVIHADKPIRSDLHPTMKPIELLGKLMQNSSKPGDAVLDPFGGSGSTLITAEQLHRSCYTMEYEPRYVDVIIDRWETFTGQKAKRIREAE